MDGTFVIYFTTPDGTKLSTYGLNVDTVTALEIQEALTALPESAIPSVTVDVSSASDSSTVFTVTFSDQYNAGAQNPLELGVADNSAQGSQPVFAVTGTVSGTPTCVRTTGVTLEESLECAGRGTCDTETGKCKCHKGFNGKACESQTSLQ
jgi:hypothetical protein